MTKIIIHVGSYKTGSSSIQNALFRMRDNLRNQGVLYPVSGLVFGYPEIGIRHRKLARVKITNRLKKLITQKLIPEIARERLPAVVISSESWSNPDFHPSLEFLLHKLTEAGFNDFRCVLYLRNISDYAVSHYREFTLNQGNELPFEQYVEQRSPTFDIPGMTSKLNEIFNNQLSCHVYDKSVDVVPEFFQCIGVADLYNSLTLRENQGSPGALGTEVIRYLNSRGLTGLAYISSFSKTEFFRETDERIYTEKPEWIFQIPSERELIKLAVASGLGDLQCKELLTPSPTTGLPISDVRDQIQRACDMWLKSAFGVSICARNELGSLFRRVVRSNLFN